MNHGSMTDLVLNVSIGPGKTIMRANNCADTDSLSKMTNDRCHHMAIPLPWQLASIVPTRIPVRKNQSIIKLWIVMVQTEPARQLRKKGCAGIMRPTSSSNAGTSKWNLPSLAHVISRRNSRILTKQQTTPNSAKFERNIEMIISKLDQKGYKSECFNNENAIVIIHLLCQPGSDSLRVSRQIGSQISVFKAVYMLFHHWFVLCWKLILDGLTGITELLLISVSARCLTT